MERPAHLMGDRERMVRRLVRWWARGGRSGCRASRPVRAILDRAACRRFRPRRSLRGARRLRRPRGLGRPHRLGRQHGSRGAAPSTGRWRVRRCVRWCVVRRRKVGSHRSLRRRHIGRRTTRVASRVSHVRLRERARHELRQANLESRYAARDTRLLPFWPTVKRLPCEIARQLDTRSGAQTAAPPARRIV